MSLWSVFVTGLFAGGASCAVVQGGLLAGAVARRRERMPVAVTPGGGAAEGSVAVAERVEEHPPGWGEDAVPVAAFMAGKLVSHVLFGALLGLFGAALQPNYQVRAYMQIGAGVLMLVMALSMFGILPAWSPSPPERFTRLVRRSARAETAFAPALLGFFTILVPCGVTLSIEFLAIASASPLSGAALMGAFVLGTTPLFTAIGYVVRRSAAVLRGHLTKLAALAVAVAGILSINSGLVLTGSKLTLQKVAPGVTKALPAALGGGANANPTAPSPQDQTAVVPVAEIDASGVQHVVINVGEGDPEGNGANPFSPSVIRVKAGTPTQLVLRAAGSLGCASSIVMPQRRLEKGLTPNGEVVVDLGSLPVGNLGYSCGVGMYSGVIQAVP